MKKQHWIALVACIMAVVIFMGSIFRNSGNPILMYCCQILSGIALVILPWAMTYKQKKWGIICAGSLALGKLSERLLFSSFSSYGIAERASGTSAASVWFYSYSPKVLAIFEVLFCILIVISLYKPIKEWLLYIYPIVSFLYDIVGVSGTIANYGTRALSWLWWYIVYDGLFLQSLMLFMAVYLLVNEAPERIELKAKAQVILSNSDETGYTYLDEYKKNMKK